jgi:hypothetical protein
MSAKVEQEAAITLEGPLEKKSRGGSWQRHWFVLSSHFLKYYRGPDKQKLKGTLEGTLDLRDLRNISIDNNSVMLVEFGDGSIYQLRSGDATKSAEWLRVLSSFIDISDMLADLGDFGSDLVGFMSDNDGSYDIFRGMSGADEVIRRERWDADNMARDTKVVATPNEDNMDQDTEVYSKIRKHQEINGEVESEPNSFKRYKFLPGMEKFLETERIKEKVQMEKAAKDLIPHTIRESLLENIAAAADAAAAALPPTPPDRSGSSKQEDAKDLCVILITTHGKLRDPVGQRKRNDIYDLFKIVDDDVFKSNGANIVKVTAAAAGSVNYTKDSEIMAWKTHIKTWMKHWCQYDGALALDQFAADTKKAGQNISRAYSKALDTSTESIWLNEDSILSVNASSQAHKDLAEYYNTNYLNGFGSTRIHSKSIPSRPLLEKTYSNKGLEDDIYHGKIEIYCCKKNQWLSLFPRDQTDKTTSDIINAIKNYSEVVILDYSCTVFASKMEKKVLSDTIRDRIVQMAIGGGKNKSKKRKRKSNKTRKRRRMPRKPKKHKKSKKPKTKRNPNKRKTKRK